MFVFFFLLYPIICHKRTEMHFVANYSAVDVRVFLGHCDISILIRSLSNRMPSLSMKRDRLPLSASSLGEPMDSC